MSDITIIYTSAMIAAEPFASLVREQLKMAAEDIPIISATRSPLDFGKNIVVPSEHGLNRNVYVAVLRACSFVKTEYIAIAEDDCLYHRSHFLCYRPERGMFSYNENYWRVYPWAKIPQFSYKRRIHFSQCIVKTDTLIESLENRIEKIPTDLNIHCEPGRYQSLLDFHGVKRFRKYFFNSPLPNVLIHHENCLAFNILGTKTKEGLNGRDNLEPWGSVTTVLNNYYKVCQPV